MMTPEPNEYLVITLYKGNPGSRTVIPLTGEDIYDACRRMDIRGVDNVYAPGDWEYDSQTLVAQSLQY